MKYKNIELELPPIGEIIVTKNEYDNYFFGYYYLSFEKRKFCSIYSLPLPGTITFLDSDYSAETKWAKMPKFKLLKTERPPIGVEVLLSWLTIAGRGYSQATNLKGYILEDRVKESYKKATVDSWIRIETFQEGGE